FAEAGIAYRVSDLTKSEIYDQLEPKINAGEVELLDEPVLIDQLLGLVMRGTKIDHAPSEHDDRINDAAGALLLARKRIDLGAALKDALDAIPDEFEREQATAEHIREMEFYAGRNGDKPWE